MDILALRCKETYQWRDFELRNHARICKSLIVLDLAVYAFQYGVLVQKAEITFSVEVNGKAKQSASYD